MVADMPDDADKPGYKQAERKRKSGSDATRASTAIKPGQATRKKAKIPKGEMDGKVACRARDRVSGNVEE